ncbi:MAG TPA: DNA methyltransferase [Isosphaeraceae bacterium]|nr:DNA methyltransferase [Isosphaeraceae bacterium]
MPVESKPLFRPDVLRTHLKTFRPPNIESHQTTLQRWASLLWSPQAETLKEQELLPDFLTDVFCGVLGYTRAVDDHDRYTFSREKYVEVDGKFADAVLGELTPKQSRFVVAVEGKGPKDPLDRPFAGRKMSAVDQGYRYAINLPCDWILVTSMRQTRLYHKGSDQYTYERFDTDALARDVGQLRRFLYLLGAERVVVSGGPSHLYGLLSASEKVGRELTKEFYLQYAEMRENAFDHLCRANPSVSPHEVLTCTQKLLDRILFCSFCEDRGLLPAETVERAYQHSDPYNPRPIWENFRGLFRAINVGNTSLNIPAYNGGLFADDPDLDRLTVPDEVCRYFQDLAAYDYRSAHEAADADEEAGQAEAKLVDVDILGHIFEQSITDLERLRNELEGLTERLDRSEHTSRRKKEGAFYTPAFITRYIVGEAMGKVLEDRFEALRQRHAEEAGGTARRVLADPRAYDLGGLNAPQRQALIRFWELWQDELAAIKLLDPSCGSGAFLIEAFEQLYQAYQQSNDRLEELRGNRTLFDLDRHILQHNLYGVDLNEEAVQIGRLSLWIKTAQRGKVLTSLDHSLRVGNSVIADPAVHPRAFDWQAAFPEVFEQGGFDVVVGNPPYVRQEWISPYKPYFQSAFRTYHGTADLYVYFYELGMRVLRPGGRLSFVVTNKWLKSSYGEPLRRFFAEETWVESVVDFGHAKQIFEDADVFPSIIVARKPTEDPAPSTTRVCAIPREQLRITDLNTQISVEGFDIQRSRLTEDSWSLEPEGVVALLSKIDRHGIPLSEYASMKPYRGILTGFNEAFLIDSDTRKNLISHDPACEPLIKRYVRGQDIVRWSAGWEGLWMIAMKSSGDHPWPWAEAGEDAERIFQATYPSLHRHLKGYEPQLRKRQDQGHYWWELRSCAYWYRFEEPKIFYQDITWQPRFNIDTNGTLSNNTVYFLPTSDLWVLATFNSPAAWAYSWRRAQHGKDEALRFFTTYVEGFPIPSPTDEARGDCETAVRRLVQIAAAQQHTVRDLLAWLRVEHEIEKPSTRLQNPIELDSESFIAEIRKLRGKKKPLSLAAFRSLREEHERTIVPTQALAREALILEHQVNDLVNEAYGLTPEEVNLIWETAPPRMPISASGA